jgi:hypothetical protein
VSTIVLVPAPPACAIFPPPPLPPKAVAVPVTLELLIAFLVSSKVRLEVPDPALPPVAALLPPPLPPAAV